MGAKEIIGVNEVSSCSELKKLLMALLAEFFGNMLLNFFGCASIVASSGALAVSLTFGLVVFTCAQALGDISGAHYNPAVTLGMLSVQNISVIRALLYIVVQCVGAGIGSALLMALLPKNFPKNATGTTAVASELSVGQGFGYEFFLGFILVLVYSGVCDPNRPEAKAAGPFAVGMTVALGGMSIVHSAVYSMNPARSFGSAVIANSWTHHWVFWAAPIAGGLVAALLYRYALTGSTPSGAADGKIEEE